MNMYHLKNVICTGHNWLYCIKTRFQRKFRVFHIYRDYYQVIPRKQY